MHWSTVIMYIWYILFGVDDKKVLQQLAAQIESGKLKTFELKNYKNDVL